MPNGYSTPMEMLARKLDSISRLADSDRAALLDLPHTVRNLPARHDIVRFGDRPTHSCLVLQGWVYRYAALAEGGRQILSFYIAGRPAGPAEPSPAPDGSQPRHPHALRRGADRA
ncbi:CRP-like cAMP-binding protein [Methylobacterium radiotolerans]|uniref:CRP-like cAMP-binding protein n=1 Tax=Methylobacterium radiotolerans TaxID=31998 RepID=A0ABV2NN38_9HYPH